MREKENHKSEVHSDFRVIYDMEKNEYIKINKELGTEVKVYKDGTDIKKFYPGLTGQFSSSQRFKDHTHSLHTQLSGTSNSRNLEVFDHRFVIRRRPQNSKFKTLDGSPKAYRPLQTHSEHQEAPPRNLAEMFPAITQRDFFKQLISNRQSIASKTPQPVDPLSQTLKRFNELRADTIYQNHSIKKNIPGSSPKISPERIHFANKKYFQTLTQDEVKQSPPARYKSQKASLPAEHFPEGLVKTQYLRDRERFFKSHPNQKTPEKPHDELRRKNLLRLQKEFIEQNQKQTNKVYGK